MPTRSPSKPVARARGLVAGLSRSRAADDPEFIAAKQQLKALSLEEHVRGIVQSWPPLTPEQIDRVAAALRSPEAGAQ